MPSSGLSERLMVVVFISGRPFFGMTQHALNIGSQSPRTHGCGPVKLLAGRTVPSDSRGGRSRQAGDAPERLIGDFTGERLHRRGTTHQHVPQRFGPGRRLWAMRSDGLQKVSEVVGDIHRGNRTDVGSAGVAERVSADGGAGSGDDRSNQLPHDLAAVTLADGEAQHCEVGANVCCGQGLAEDVGSLEVGPLGYTIAVGSCLSSVCCLGVPRRSQRS
jgi:hypothetical protein